MEIWLRQRGSWLAEFLSARFKPPIMCSGACSISVRVCNISLADKTIERYYDNAL